MNDPANHFFSWSFERPFHFESSGLLEAVVRSLAQLEEEGGFFISSSRNDISILPAGEGYNFRYRIRRHSENTTYTTAVGEGQVWQAEHGPVIVEGQAQIEAGSLYGSMGMLMFMAFIAYFLSFAGGFFSFMPLIMLAAGAFVILRYYTDRNLVIDRIAEAVASTHNLPESVRQEKNKQAPNAALNTSHTMHPDSVWNDAISEYETWERN